MTGSEHGGHIGLSAGLASVFRGSWDFSGYLDFRDQRIEPVAEPLKPARLVEVVVSSFKIELGLSRSATGVG